MTLALYGKSRRRQWMLVALALIGIAGALSAAVAMLTPAGAASVTPTFVSGNPSCAGPNESLGFAHGFKPTPEGNPTGTFPLPNGGSITVTENGAQTGIDWTSTFPILAVIVKGGPNANVYYYTPGGSLGDTGLVTPLNNSQPFGLSHVEFCWNTDPTPTPTPTEPTEPPETVTETATPTPETPTPTNTPVTATPTNTPVTATPTNTPVTATPTNTPVTPTPTNTPVTPTSTPQVPTPTPEIPTPTPEIPTPVPTATPEPPTAVPTQAPTNVEPEPTETSAEAGERIPGPTPIAPSTGAGNGAAGGGLNLLLIVAGLAALGSGLTLTLAGKRQRG